MKNAEKVGLNTQQDRLSEQGCSLGKDFMRCKYRNISVRIEVLLDWQDFNKDTRVRI